MPSTANLAVPVSGSVIKLTLSLQMLSLSSVLMSWALPSTKACQKEEVWKVGQGIFTKCYWS